MAWESEILCREIYCEAGGEAMKYSAYLGVSNLGCSTSSHGEWMSYMIFSLFSFTTKDRPIPCTTGVGNLLSCSG